MTIKVFQQSSSGELSHAIIEIRFLEEPYNLTKYKSKNMDTIKIRDGNGVSRRIDAGRKSRILHGHSFSGKRVDPVVQVAYDSDFRYPNSIRID